MSFQLITSVQVLMLLEFDEYIHFEFMLAYPCEAQARNSKFGG